MNFNILKFCSSLSYPSVQILTTVLALLTQYKKYKKSTKNKTNIKKNKKIEDEIKTMRITRATKKQT